MLSRHPVPSLFQFREAAIRALLESRKTSPHMMRFAPAGKQTVFGDRMSIADQPKRAMWS
jgi:hypothetical protein